MYRLLRLARLQSYKGADIHPRRRLLGLGLLPGYLLAYRFDMGIYGFWTALIASLTIAAIALVWCLELCSREMVRSHKAV